MDEYFNKNYFEDKISALDAKFEAQKIAYAPLTFQAVRALIELGFLKAISDSGENGLSFKEAAEKTSISLYGAKVLLEIALGMNIVKMLPKTPPGTDSDDRFILGKIGWFLLEDTMTSVSLNFVNDVCYKGAFELLRSVKDGKPLGLEVFGHEGKTIYEVLSTLPEQVKESWFTYEHYFSDIGFEEAIPIVFSDKPKKVIDIGGNTAKWALCCCRYDPDVEVLIVDLPGQTAVADRNAAQAGFSDRIKTFSCNILNKETVLPAETDIIWMSQFLDCFSLEEITQIMEKAQAASGPTTDVYILEYFLDKQRYEMASFSLRAISLYFTCMANGNSKMYSYGEFAEAIERAGFDIVDTWHNMGPNNYSLLRCRSRS
ncbi:MAG: class I SAM-dependent methyltransferase [Treponema sp.]|nr:class I SAM-dependent methyltransferase [Treponema sp.]